VRILDIPVGLDLTPSGHSATPLVAEIELPQPAGRASRLLYTPLTWDRYHFRNVVCHDGASLAECCGAFLSAVA
jgi:hypothetical protein